MQFICRIINFYNQIPEDTALTKNPYHSLITNKLKANPFPLGDGFAFIVYF